MKKKKFQPGQIGAFALLSLWALTTIYPIFWVVLNSFSLPIGEKFSMANYQLAFERLDIFGAYRNSLIISLSVAVVVILLAGMASYALVRYTFRGRNLYRTSA